MQMCRIFYCNFSPPAAQRGNNNSYSCVAFSRKTLKFSFEFRSIRTHIIGRNFNDIM